MTFPLFVLKGSHGTPVSRKLAELRWVGLASTMLAFALVAWGAIVRINGAGMTCPDWPRCRGAWLPALNDPVVYEWTHRLAAMLLTAAIVATFVFAWRARREAPAAMRAAWVPLALIVAQIFAGWLTIKYANNPPSVAVHLVVGFATFISLLVVTLGAFAARGYAAPRFPLLGWMALASTVLAFTAVFAAGYMSASQAGLACVRFPLCNGFAGASGSLQAIHMGHRFAAYATLIAVVATWLISLRVAAGNRALTATAWLALALALLQGVLGVLAVVTRLEPVIRSWHEANAALLVGCLSMLALLSFGYGTSVARVECSDEVEHEAERRAEARRSSPVSAATTRVSAATTRVSAATTRVSAAKARVSAAKIVETIKSYAELTKPNVMSLLLFTTLGAMMIAAGGFPSWRLVLLTMLGGALASASSGAINMYLDRDIDAQMKRTRRRPIPSGRVQAHHALVFGVVLGVLACAELGLSVNVLAALLALAGIVYYVFVYTIWLKRSTPQNIVIGGAAGSVPPLVGWAAVTNHVGITALALFAIVFVWTPPHFWALALMKREEYARVGIPMMPAVHGDAATKRQIIAYTIALAALTIVLVPMHLMGFAYLACALVLDGVFLGFALWVARIGSMRSEGLMYRFSMIYLALLFVAMVIDRLGHGVTAS